MAVCQNLVPLVNIKIAGKWMFIPLKMVLIGIDPYLYSDTILIFFSSFSAFATRATRAVLVTTSSQTRHCIPDVGKTMPWPTQSTGNGKFIHVYTTYKNADFPGGWCVYGVVLPAFFSYCFKLFHHFYRCYGYHSQSWLVYTILFSRLKPMIYQ